MTASKRSVLIVEDEADIALLEAEYLESEGYLTVQARHGAHALALLDVFQPTVIVLDLMMPVMDGLGFLRAYAERAPEARAPVVAVSAFEGYLEEAAKLGVRAVLCKPFDLDALLGAVEATASGSPVRPRPRPTPLDERQRLRAVVELRLDHPSPTAALDEFVKRVARIFGVPICLVSMITAGRQFWHAHCGLPSDLASARGTPRSDSFCTHAVEAASPLVVQDARDNPFFADNQLVRERGLRFYAGVPLFGHGGVALGTLCLLDFAPRSFSPCDVALLTVLARRVMAELEWRERAGSPAMPLSTFRSLEWVDGELDILGREAFVQALQVETCQALERKEELALVLLDAPQERLAAVCDDLKLGFERALLGRLDRCRLGLLQLGSPRAEVEERARQLAGEGATVVALTVPMTSPCPRRTVRAMEGRLDPADGTTLPPG